MIVFLFNCKSTIFFKIIITLNDIAREVHGGPEGVRSTERSEARNAPTRSEAEGHAQVKISLFITPKMLINTITTTK